jgi:cell division transport system permease protein
LANLAIARTMVAIRSILSIVSLVIIAVLLAISLFIISNTIKLATFERREEIAIMKMVGATNSFIRWPFLLEGCILGVFGSMSAYAVLWSLYGVISRSAIEIESFLFTLVPFSDISMELFLIFGAIGFGVGVVGSAMTLNRYLKV